MSNIKKTSVEKDARVELHDVLALTGAEVSINTLPAGTSVPFIHFHRNNEEIYGVISGIGKAIIDGEEVLLNQGDWLNVSPKQKRQFFADSNESITFVCIQVKANSLEEYTMDDAEVVQ